VIATDMATKLLDDVIYQRVLSCIDLEELALLEQELWLSVRAVGRDPDESLQHAREMLDRAFARIQSHPHRYVLGFDAGSACEQPQRVAQERATKPS
jgi:hypothetical protein